MDEQDQSTSSSPEKRVMDDMQQAMACFVPDSMTYIMAGPRDMDGHIGVRFGGYQGYLKCMFEEIATHLYQAMVISKEQWKAACAEERVSEH